MKALLLSLLISLGIVAAPIQPVPPSVNTEGLCVVEVAEQTEPTETVQMIATAYCGCAQCCGKSDGITASGTVATEGRTIAADLSVFPFGTQLRIDGVDYVVEDCGGGINGNRLDIYFASHSDALAYGVKTVTVEVIE